MRHKIALHRRFLLITCLYLLVGYSQFAIAELKIYYMHGKFPDQSLWVMDADGSNKRLFMKPPIPMFGLLISPDGKKLLFTNPQFGKIGGARDDKLMIMNLDGSNLREFLANPPRDIVILGGPWSPDGKRLIYKTLDPRNHIKDEVFVSDAEGRNTFELLSDFEHPPFRFKSGFSWFPDSQRIAFSTDFPSKLYMVEATPKAKPELMNIQLWAAYAIRWSLDGKRTIIIGETIGGERNEIFLGDELGRIIVRLTKDNDDQGGAEWLPDGKHIIFTTLSQFPMDVAIMDVETKQVRRLTDDGQSSFAFWYDPTVFSVDPLGKLLTSWGKIKSQY